MNILIVNHNGGSLRHGPNLRTYYAAKALVKHGHEVTIASSSYSHKYSVLPETKGIVTNECIDGIQYKWIKCAKYRNLLQRIFSHFEFGFRLLTDRGSVCTCADLVIFSGPPPELFLFSWILAKKLGAPIVSDIRDLWPRTQLEMNGWQWLNPYTHFLFICQFFLVHGSDQLTSPLPGIGKYISKLGRTSGIFIIENGIDLDRVSIPRDVALRIMAGGESVKVRNTEFVTLDQIRRENKFIVGYSGAFDRDNDLGSLLGAAKHLAHRNDILFMFVGAGVRRDYLRNMAASLPNVLICDRVSPADVRSVIGVMDVCYCGLKPKSIYQYGVSLAKSFEYMASAKPVLWMVDACNNPIGDCGGGITIDPYKIADLVVAIERCASMGSEEIIEMGRLGYDFIEKNHSYRILGTRWAELVDNFHASDRP